jgi:hypothetical protein
MKSILYRTATVLPGNKIEIEVPSLTVGQSVEIVVLVQEASDYSSEQEPNLSLEQRLGFLKLPISERRRILKDQTEKMVTHYQENSEWQELMSGDIIDY